MKKFLTTLFGAIALAAASTAAVTDTEPGLATEIPNPANVDALPGSSLGTPGCRALGQSAIQDRPWKAGNTASWAQSTIETFNGYQYVSYYNKDKCHCVARRKLPGGPWQSFAFSDYQFTKNLAEGDGHNNTVLGICPQDGTIHLAFDHHAQPLHYRISVKNLALTPEKFTWGPELFSKTTSSLGGGTDIPTVTYPRFFRAPNNTLQLSYRIGFSGNGDSCLHEYNPATGWSSLGTFIKRSGTYDDPARNLSSTSRNAYFNGFTYDHDKRLHVTWCWREEASHEISYNHDLMYMYSDDFGRTWQDSTGKPIGETGKKFVTLKTPGIKVWDIPMGKSYINQCAQAVDSKGRIHVVTWHVPPGTIEDVADYASPEARYYHYYRETDGIWKRNDINLPRGTRPKLFFDDQDNAFLLAGHTVIYTASPEKSWQDWRKLFSEEVGSGNATFDHYRWISEKILTIWTHELCSADYRLTVPTQGR